VGIGHVGAMSGRAWDDGQQACVAECRRAHEVGDACLHR
jgi:hypothetical protein